MFSMMAEANSEVRSLVAPSISRSRSYVTRFCWMVRAMPSSISRAASPQPRKSNIIAPERITELGLMTSLSAYFGAVRGFKAAKAVTDIGARRHAQPADLRSAGIRQIVAVQVGRRQHLVLIGARQHLLENGVGDAVVHHQFLLPLALAMAGVERLEHLLDLGLHFLLELLVGLLQARLDHRGVLLDADVGVAVAVGQDPALALGDNVRAEFIFGQFVAPVAERALGKFLDVAFVHQRDQAPF